VFCSGAIFHLLPPDIKITQVDLAKRAGVDRNLERGEGSTLSVIWQNKEEVQALAHKRWDYE